jgi:hypothetical protein
MAFRKPVSIFGTHQGKPLTPSTGDTLAVDDARLHGGLAHNAHVPDLYRHSTARLAFGGCLPYVYVGEHLAATSLSNLAIYQGGNLFGMSAASTIITPC